MATPTISGSSSSVPLSGIKTIDALLEGVKWSNAAITYSFANKFSQWSNSLSAGYGSSNSDAEPWNGNMDYFTATENVRVRAALAQWANVSNLQFTETLDTASLVGDIRFAYGWTEETAGAEAWAYTPDGTAIGGDVWVSTDSNSYHSQFAAGSYAFMTLMHELGHALGLKHPHETAGSNLNTLSPALDSLARTVMSYFSSPGDTKTYLSFYPTTLMLYDIQAIQRVYGKNTSFNAGNTVYSYNDSATYLETIWDAGGINTISYSGTNAAMIDLREGTGSSFGNEVTVRNASGARVDAVPNVWIAYGTAIQNAVGGSGRNTLIGNNLSNTLTGGSASNNISAGAGNDTVILNSIGSNVIDGGTGIDTLVLDGTRSSFTITASSNGFSVSRSGTPGMDTLSGVERIKFSDSTVAMDITGNGGQAYRLYQAAFDRAPDKGGLGYWIDKMDAGFSLTDVAGGFFNSPEFKALYGTSPSNTEYINRFYQNVLHRAPEAEGFKYWMNALTIEHRSPITALAQFSESPENQAQVIGVIQNGMEYSAVA